MILSAARGIRDQTNPDKQSFRFGWSRVWGQIFFAKLEGSPLAPLSTERAAVVLLINDQWGGARRSRIDFPPKMLPEFGFPGGKWGGGTPS